MANKTIHELSPATTVGSEYEFAIYDTDNNTTKKTSIDDIMTKSVIDELNTTSSNIIGAINQINTRLGSSDISNVGSNITSIIGNNTLATTSQNISGAVNELNSKIGNTSISGIGNGTVTGAISTLNSNFVKTVDTAVTDLASIPQGFGYYNLAASISPIGSQGYFAIICTGNGEGRKAYFAVRTSTNEVFETTYHQGSSPEVKSWQKMITADMFSIAYANGSATSIAANATAWLTAPLPTGKTVIALSGYYLNGGTTCSVYNTTFSSTGASVAVRNNSGTASTVTLTAYYLCI